MILRRRKLPGGREISLELIEGLWVVLIIRRFPRFDDILHLEEFYTQQRARNAYRRLSCATYC